MDEAGLSLANFANNSLASLSCDCNEEHMVGLKAGETRLCSLCESGGGSNNLSLSQAA
jgi:hypothetical protein